MKYQILVDLSYKHTHSVFKETKVKKKILDHAKVCQNSKRKNFFLNNLKIETKKSWIYGLLTAGLSYYYTIINKDIFSHTLNRILGLSEFLSRVRLHFLVPMNDGKKELLCALVLTQMSLVVNLSSARANYELSIVRLLGILSCRYSQLEGQSHIGLVLGSPRWPQGRWGRAGQDQGRVRSGRGGTGLKSKIRPLPRKRGRCAWTLRKTINASSAASKWYHFEWVALAGMLCEHKVLKADLHGMRR